MRSRSASPSRLRLGTRQRTGSPSRDGVPAAAGPNAGPPAARRQGVVEAVGGAGDGAPDAAGGPVALDGQDVAVAAAPRLGQRVGQQRKAAGLALAVPHQQLHQPVLQAEPGQLRGLLDRLAERVTRQGGHQVQPLLGETTEAGLGAEATDVVAAHGDDHRRHLGGVLGDASAEAADDVGGMTQGEELLELVDHQDGRAVDLGDGRVHRRRRGPCRGRTRPRSALAAGGRGPARPAPATTCRSPRVRRRPAAASTAGARGTPRSRRRDRRRSPRHRRHRTPGPCTGTPRWPPPPRGPPRAWGPDAGSRPRARRGPDRDRCRAHRPACDGPGSGTGAHRPAVRSGTAPGPGWPTAVPASAPP